MGINMNIYVSTQKTTIDDAPIGLMLHDNGTILMKTEYYYISKDPGVYIVQSGKYYCGEMDEVCVQPIIFKLD